jgi:hypothetical protein
LFALTIQEIQDLTKKVNSWAKENSLEDFNYGSPSRYWASAKAYDVISQQEYDYMRDWMGDTFYYTGD